ncbi:MAG: hypothetical protein F8N37_15365 [Telmatospirillum sp.]|nr:hypothetical protein [Telmatospirillum sp.]
MLDGAEKLRFHDCDLYLLRNARQFPDDMRRLEPDLLRLATLARGWGPDKLDHMRQVFKIDPFYNATAMALVFNGDNLVGTAGVDTDFDAGRNDRHIVHLCSVNMDRSLRNSGLIAQLFVILADQVLASLPPGDEVFFTSISQSPLVYSIMSKIAPLHPDGRSRPPAPIVDVAGRVVAKYDPHLELEPDTLVLRRECDFFYRDVPYVSDTRINALFDSLLDIAAGDVFVNVGRTDVAGALSKIGRYQKRAAQL